MKGTIEGKVIWLVISIIIAIFFVAFLSGFLQKGIALFGKAIRITLVGLINLIAAELGWSFIHFT